MANDFLTPGTTTRNNLFPQYISGSPSGLIDAMKALGGSSADPQTTLNAWLSGHGWLRPNTSPAGFHPSVSTVAGRAMVETQQGAQQLLNDIHAAGLPMPPQLDIDMRAAAMDSIVNTFPGILSTTPTTATPGTTPTTTSATPPPKAPTATAAASAGLSLKDPKVIAVGALILAALFSK